MIKLSFDIILGFVLWPVGYLKFILFYEPAHKTYEWSKFINTRRRRAFLSLALGLVEGIWIYVTFAHWGPLALAALIYIVTIINFIRVSEPFGQHRIIIDVDSYVSSVLWGLMVGLTLIQIGGFFLNS